MCFCYLYFNLKRHIINVFVKSCVFKQTTPMNFALGLTMLKTKKPNLLLSAFPTFDVGSGYNFFTSLRCLAQNMCSTSTLGRAIAQTASSRLPTAAARVPSQVMWDFWWAKWHWGRVSPSSWVSQSTLVPPTAP
jgi:hypothetical protein